MPAANAGSVASPLRLPTRVEPRAATCAVTLVRSPSGPVMLKQRVTTALILAPLLVALIFLTKASVFATLLGLIFLLGVWEWTRMAGMHGHVVRALVLVGYAVVFACAWK
ncbi:MAG: hypothetical protein EPN40_13810, partial [Rhodanobacteraceae bacterium]